jgi:hypothetical protein
MTDADAVLELYAKLRRSGLSVGSLGERIVLEGERRFLTPRTLAAVARHRGGLRALLALDRVAAELERSLS